MQVYLTVLILKPTQKAIYDEGAVPLVVAGPNIVLADNDTSASAKAMAFLPDDLKDKSDRIEVAVLPFRRSGN